MIFDEIDMAAFEKPTRKYLVKKEVIFHFAERPEHGRTHLMLMARVPSDEVFHVRVTADGALYTISHFIVSRGKIEWSTYTFEDHSFAITINNGRALNTETGLGACGRHVVPSVE